MEICWRTKKEDPPRGKPKVYLSCYESDFSTFGKKIIEQLHEICDCAVYFYPPHEKVVTDEAYRFELEQMDLIVIPVTAALLCKPNRTMDFDIEFAQKHHIPVLPLLQERNLERMFQDRLGHLQYLWEGDRDRTVIPYLEKLKKFLASVLVGDQLAEEIRRAFGARIFLSYRKKDRALAQKLMELIHEDPQMRDVAIWYDEFLIPGDDFDKNINRELEKSDLFLLAVTPNLLEPANYVMTEEYPAANQVLPVVPAQLEETDWSRMQECYPGIDEPVDAYDAASRSQKLHRLLQGRLQENADPAHSYLMGLAYLSGIDVEKNAARAVQLLTEAAEQGVSAAAKKLAWIYHWGDGIPCDDRKAKYWAQRLVDMTKERLCRQDSEDHAFAFYEALQTAVVICSANLDQRVAQAYALRAVPAAKQLCEQYNYSEQLLIESYWNIGRILSEQEEYEKAFQYQKKAVELEELQYQTQRDMQVRQRLVDRYCEIAETCEALESLQIAADYYKKAEEIQQVILKVRRNRKTLEDLLELDMRLEEISKALGDKPGKRQYAKKIDRLFKAYQKDRTADGTQVWTAAARYYVSRWRLGKAIRIIEHEIKKQEAQLEKEKTFTNRRMLAAAYATIATVWLMKKRVKKARAAALLAKEIYEEVAEEYPCTQSIYELVDSYAGLGDTYDHSALLEPDEVYYSDYRLSEKNRESVETACGCYEKALQLLERVEGNADLPEHQKRRAELIETLGRLYQALGRKEEAVTIHQEYRELCLQLLDARRSEISCDRYAEACFRLAMLTRERELMEEAYDLWARLSEDHPNYIKKKKEALRLLNL